MKSTPPPSTPSSPRLGAQRLVQSVTSDRSHLGAICLWPGTDADVAFPIHRELGLYVKAGIPAAEVLKIASHDTYIEVYLGADLRTSPAASGRTLS